VSISSHPGSRIARRDLRNRWSCWHYHHRQHPGCRPCCRRSALRQPASERPEGRVGRWVVLRWSSSDAIGSSDRHFKFEALTTFRHGMRSVVEGKAADAQLCHSCTPTSHLLSHQMCGNPIFPSVGNGFTFSRCAHAHAHAHVLRDSR